MRLCVSWLRILSKEEKTWETQTAIGVGTNYLFNGEHCLKSCKLLTFVQYNLGAPISLPPGDNGSAST